MLRFGSNWPHVHLALFRYPLCRYYSDDLFVLENRGGLNLQHWILQRYRFDKFDVVTQVIFFEIILISTPNYFVVYCVNLSQQLIAEDTV